MQLHTNWAGDRMATTQGGTMETISGRVPDELYRWFAHLKVDGAVTNSDKLRVLLAQLKRQHEGTLDLASAQAWARDITAPLRQALSTVERDEGSHSEVVSILVEHLSALAAILVSAQPRNRADAISLEEMLVRRAFGLAEALLRQAVTPQAAAFEPGVVRKHCDQCITLAKLVH